MASKLLIDSGSTKADWALLKNGQVTKFQTKGVNPSADPSFYDLNQSIPTLNTFAKTIEEVYFYGAGVINDTTKSLVTNWLKSYIPNASKINVDSDMIGAAKAAAGDNEGIISILGTGSNSCLYDGETIIDNIPALGFSISNEGGGTEIGKAILRDYFYRRMPSDVREEFEQEYPIDKSEVVFNLYQKDNPTYYIASFSKFINITNNKEWRKDLLTPIFEQFIDIRIKGYKDYHSKPLHFVGSIAYFCHDVIRDVLQKNDLELTSIDRRPIDGLIQYHK